MKEVVVEMGCVVSVEAATLPSTTAVRTAGYRHAPDCRFLAIAIAWGLDRPSAGGAGTRPRHGVTTLAGPHNQVNMLMWGGTGASAEVDESVMRDGRDGVVT